MSDDLRDVIGRILPAPENHLDAARMEEARKARRSFMGKALAMGAGAVAAASAARPARAEGEDAILKMPEHTGGLGQGVATDGYGKPSQWEGNLQRPPEPGPDPGQPGLGELHAAAGPVRHHHAQRPALRAPPPGLVGHRSFKTPPDGPRPGEARARVHHGRPDAPAQASRASTSSNAVPIRRPSGATWPCRRCSTRTA